MTFMDDSAMAAEGGYVVVTVTGLVNYLMGLRWVRHPHTHQRVLIYKPDESQKRAFLPFSADPEFDAPSADGFLSAPPPPPQPPARLFRPPTAASSRVARRLATSQKSLPQQQQHPPGPASPSAAAAIPDKPASRRRRASKTFKLSSLLFWLSSSSSSDASSDSDPASDADLNDSKGIQSRTASFSRRPSMLSETGSSLGSTPSTSSTGSALAAAVASGKTSSASAMVAPPSPSPWTSRYADKAPSSRVVRSARTSPVSAASAASTQSNDELPTVRVWLQPSAARKAIAHYPSADSRTNPSADSGLASSSVSEAVPVSAPVSATAGAADAVTLDLGALIHDSYFPPQTAVRAPDARASDQSPAVALPPPLPRFAVQRVSPILSSAAIAASSSTRASSMSPAAATPVPTATGPATESTPAANSSSGGGGASASSVVIPFHSGAAVGADASGRESPFAPQSAASSLSSSVPRAVSMGRGVPSGDWRMRNISKFMQQ